MTRHELLEIEIASILDMPSVFMGGPSVGNRRRAAKIIGFLVSENLLQIDSAVQDATSDE